MDLYLHLADGSLRRDRNGTTGPITALQLNQGDKLRIRLWLMQDSTATSNTQSAPLVPVPLPAPYTLLYLAGKAADALSGADYLFQIGDWTETTVVFNEGEANEYSEVHYEADLNLNTEEIDAVMTPAVGDPVDSFAFYYSLTFTDGDENQWTPVTRAEGTMLRDLYTGGPAPTPSDPVYPAADQLPTKLGSNYQFVKVAGVFELRVKNTTTDTWHRVSIQGASGAEALVIDDPA